MHTFDEITKKLENVNTSKETILIHLHIENHYTEDTIGDYCFFGLYGDMVSLAKKEYLLRLNKLRAAVESEDSEILEGSDMTLSFDISEDVVQSLYEAPVVTIESLK